MAHTSFTSLNTQGKTLLSSVTVNGTTPTTVPSIICPPIPDGQQLIPQGAQVCLIFDHPDTLTRLLFATGQIVVLRFPCDLSTIATTFCLLETTITSAATAMVVMAKVQNHTIATLAPTQAVLSYVRPATHTWSGIGINYGHVATYDPTQVETDFTYLQSMGITRVRIAMPPYNSSTNVPNGQDMCQRALNHGFSVIWGVTTSGTVTSTVWTAFKDYVVNTLAPWAQQIGITEFSLGNEVELHVDGTTLTIATVRSDVRAMATTIKGNGYTGRLIYSTSILTTYRNGWISEGIGAMDAIGFNSYDTTTNFTTRASAIVSSFGSTTFITEFGSVSTGYGDFSDETLFYNDTATRITAMQNAGITRGYFFCYRDGGYGVTANSFALVKSDGNPRLARQAVFGL